MRRPIILTLFLFFVFNGLVSIAIAQPNTPSISVEKRTEDPKPYKILTNGKKITIQSEQKIKSVLVWTASGHRIVEQKKIEALSFTFTVTVKENILFIMVVMENGKRYTSKIGVN